MSRYWELQDMLNSLYIDLENIEDEMNEYPLGACPIYLQREYDEIAEEIAAIEEGLEELVELEDEEENEWDEDDDDEPISFSVVEEKEDII